MNDLSTATTSPRVYHYHWLAFWKPMAVIGLLVVLGVGAILVWLPVGLGLLALALALIGAVSLYLYWSRHTFAFTPDNRLILRRGVLGSTIEVTSLFGVVVSYQIPVLGPRLDVGSVRLSPFGRSIHIRHIAHFEAFYSRLVHGVQPAEAGSALDYHGTTIREEVEKVSRLDLVGSVGTILTTLTAMVYFGQDVGAVVRVWLYLLGGVIVLLAGALLVPFFEPIRGSTPTRIMKELMLSGTEFPPQQGKSGMGS